VPVAGVASDLLGGLPVPDSHLARISFAHTPAKPAVELEFSPRPAFVNYRQWVKGQDIAHVAAQFRDDLPLVAGEPNVIHLQIHNTGAASAEGDLKLETPAGWIVEPARRRVQTAAHSSTMLDLRVTPPEGQRSDGDLAATFAGNGPSFQVSAKLHPLPRARVPRLATAPALDGTDLGWADVLALTIAPTNLVQGKVTDEADSSAIFRLAHDGQALFVDVQVKDDAVITNIAPNDIRGHWRGDAVEICIDTAVGAEDTLSSFKLGIFPFDTTGVVRAARDADANQGPVEETAPKTRLVSRRTAEGYRIQVAIPFEEMGLGRDKKRLGFNLIIYDGDKRDAALGENINKSRIAWAPRSGVQGRPEDWGRIDLE
jgi:hypothetical protein